MEQYKKDGRIIRGLQRGAHSFATCTAMSALEITNRLVQTVQVYIHTKFDNLWICMHTHTQSVFVYVFQVLFFSINST